MDQLTGQPPPIEAVGTSAAAFVDCFRHGPLDRALRVTGFAEFERRFGGQDAYFVKCDAQTTTQDDVERGVVNVVVGFAPLRPAEFVVLRIRRAAGREQCQEGWRDGR